MLPLAAYTGALLLLAALLAMSLILVNETVDATGALEAREKWIVRPAVDGTVSRVLVKSGQKVAAGQVLVELDPSDATLRVFQLRALHAAESLDRSRAIVVESLEVIRRDEADAVAAARLIRARADLQARMADYGFGRDMDSLLANYVPGSHASLDVAVALVKTAEAERRSNAAGGGQGRVHDIDLRAKAEKLRALDVERSALENRLERFHVRALGGGTVVTSAPENLLGRLVTAGEPLLTVANTMQWAAVVSVDESDVHRLRVGSVAVLELPALKDQGVLGPVAARVVDVSYEPVASGAELSTTRQPPRPRYHVRLALDSGQLAAPNVRSLRDGYGVRASIITGKRRLITLVGRLVFGAP